jgi:CheY-specific phosphatase CheX
MNKLEKNTILNDVVCQVLEQTAFVFPDKAAKPDDVSFEEWDFVKAQLSFRGDRNGEVIMVVPIVFSGELAENMLGEDVDATDNDENRYDALNEIINIIAGQLLTRYFGDKRIFNLMPPKARELSREELNELIEKSDYSFCVSDGYPIISLFPLEERTHEHSRTGG